MSDTARHPIFARLYAASSPGVERKGGAEHRAEMLAGLAGRVVEVGAGAGGTSRHYPAGGDRGRRGRARALPARAGARRPPRAASVPITVRRRRRRRAPRSRTAPATRRSPASCCAGPRPGQRARRAAPRPAPRRRAALLRARARARAGLARWQRTARPHLLAARFGGCHTARDTVGAIARAGFDDRACAAIRLQGRPRRASAHRRRRAARRLNGGATGNRLRRGGRGVGLGGAARGGALGLLLGRLGALVGPRLVELDAPLALLVLLRARGWRGTSGRCGP